MNTQVLASEHSYSRRLAIARERQVTFAWRAVANALSLAGVELLTLIGVLVLAGFIRQVWFSEVQMVLGGAWVVLPLYLGGAVLAKLLPGYGLGAVEELRRLIWLLVAVFSLAIVGIWLTGPGPGVESSRLTIGVAGVLALLAVPLSRIALKSMFIRHDFWGVPVVVYGAGRAGAQVVRQLQEERGMGYLPAAVFDDDRSRWGDFLDMIPIVGGTDRVTTEAAVAFLAMPEVPPQRQVELLEGPLSCYGTVVIIPRVLDAPTLWVRPRDFVGLLGLEVTCNLTRPQPRLLKRTIDLGISLLGLPLWGSVVLISALLIWLNDRQWPFFLQERIGADGEVFHAWKLRTMVANADAVLERALKSDPALRKEWETYYKLENDPRITGIGRFLRKTSLDELPQLINVLSGEMSLVGPRPLPRYHHAELGERVRELRERVRPGITGLWQVSGRSDSGTLGMERWDPYYVRNWSIWLDLVILVRTARVVLHGSGAY